MPSTDLFDTIADDMADHFGLDRATISREMTFVQLGLDSLALVEFAMVITDRFGVELDDLRPDSMLGDAAELVATEVAASARS